ncbi:hypothetical protein GOBAR_AA31043 [Gossypium barbadense]|uniref:NADP-dependent oxidoreductase domain-containing protein n=1 Tax=Gossypium barbadense TaxID=3634 RepID=A0A2P5WEY5_GOSBA|nr:hypothetical protein GOBAR_AA31043 [Gossypium barbadense]
MVDEQQRVQIPRVKLGTQGLEVLGFKVRVWVYGSFWIFHDPVSDDVGIMIIKHAFEEGITFFDTTDLYGHKTNEILVEKLATKFGVESIGPGGLVVSGTPEYVCASLESSLKRLDVDYIDLYYIIRVDTKTPIAETVEPGHKGEHWIPNCKKLVEEGKIKYIGISEASPETIRRAHAVHPITAVQMEWALWTHDIEEEVVPLCSKLALAWVLHQGDDVAPIPDKENLDSNIESLKVKLTEEDLKEISEIIPINEVAGAYFA